MIFECPSCSPCIFLGAGAPGWRRRGSPGWSCWPSPAASQHSVQYRYTVKWLAVSYPFFSVLNDELRRKRLGCISRVHIQKELISGFKREICFLSKEIWESLRLISKLRDLLASLKTGFYGAWHNGVPPESGLRCFMHEVARQCNKITNSLL